MTGTGRAANVPTPGGLITDSTASNASTVEVLSAGTCWELLEQHGASRSAVGRIAFVADGLPEVFPVNYRVGTVGAGPWIILRVRPDHEIDRAPAFVAFEIDGVDDVHRAGWSVLVRGALHHLDPGEIAQLSERSDPAPWPRDDRSAWLAIKARTVSGRRLRAPEQEWAFTSDAYL